MAQLRCYNPQCGGYKVDDVVTKVLVHKQTGELGSSAAIYTCLLLAGVAFFVGLISDNPVEGSAALFLPPFMLLSALALLIGGAVYAARYRQVKLHSYTCQLCGYQWQWREDQASPLPPASYTPSDLVARGAALLEQQQRTAAAAAYEEQRRRARH